MGDLILVFDEGTTSTRAVLFDGSGNPVARCQQELRQYYRGPGMVEHDAGEIWKKSLDCARRAVADAGGTERIAAIGITNQRETVVAWDRQTGRALTRAIVWQDRRTADRCAELRQAGKETLVQQRTGLLLDPYFSASKMEWMLANVEEVRTAGPRLAFGTIDSWLLWNLSGGAVHATDASNASRTMLMALGSACWDDGLCDLFGVDPESLPAIVDCSGSIALTDPSLFGRPIPIAAMAGDQQAATIGQACLMKGATKATLGTGAFVLTNAGGTSPASASRLLSTLLLQIDGQRSYALEGSVFVAGSLMQWLRDALGLIATSAESEVLARSVEDCDGVTLVPALSGLGAPHWRPEARALLTGMSFATTKAHVVRAALEAQSHQIVDLMQAFARDGVRWDRLRIDGGMAANDWLAQDLADMTGLEVERPDFVETTSLGAAMLAAAGCGLHSDLPAATREMRGQVRLFEPAMKDSVRDARMAAWHAALSKT